MSNNIESLQVWKVLAHRVELFLLLTLVLLLLLWLFRFVGQPFPDFFIAHFLIDIKSLLKIVTAIPIKLLSLYKIKFLHKALFKIGYLILKLLVSFTFQPRVILQKFGFILCLFYLAFSLQGISQLLQLLLNLG